MKIAFSGASLIRFLTDQSVWQPLVQHQISPYDIDKLPDCQILAHLISYTLSDISGEARRTAGTRYFFLSMVGMSDFSAFSQMT
jgi:hypothetical protein